MSTTECEDEAVALAKLIAACTPPPQPINRKRSFVWRYFEFRGDDKTAVYCKICEKGLRFRDSTSALQYHLKNVHNVQMEQVFVAVSNNSDKHSDKSITHKSIDADMMEKTEETSPITTAIYRFVVDDMHDPQIVEGIGFKKLLEGLVPDFNPSEDLSININQYIDIEYERVRRNVQKDLDSSSHVSISLESWEGEACARSYVLLVAHFLDSNWRPQHRVLSTCHFEGILTTTEVAESLCSTLENWKILEKSTLVSESTPEMYTVASLVGVDYWPCAADALNQALIADALESVPEVKDLFQKAELFFYFVYQKKRDLEFPEKCESNGGQPDLSLLDEISLPETGLINEERHRYVNYSNINELLTFTQQYINLLKNLILENNRQDLLLCNQEADMLKQLLSFLDMFGETVKIMCEDDYPLLNKAGLTIKDLQRGCGKDSGDLGIIDEFKSIFLKSLKDRLAHWDILARLAALLDKGIEQETDSDDRDFMTEQSSRLLSRYFPKLMANSDEDKHGSNDECSSAKRRKASTPHRNGTKKGAILQNLVEKLSQNKVPVKSKALEREIDNFLKVPNKTTSQTELDWWKINESQYPCLSKIAKIVYSVPSVHKASFRAFQGNYDSFYSKRSRLGRHIVDKIIFLKENKLNH